MTADHPSPDPVRLFAALSGPFEPKQALRAWRIGDDPDRIAMAATLLAEACDTNPAGAGERWLMRTPARHTLLKSMDPAQLTAAARARRAGDPEADAETADLLAVLLDEPPLATPQVQAIVAAGDDRVQLERVIVALDRAGDLAPAHALLTPARAALARIRRDENRRRVAERGFFGREVQSAEIARWLSRPLQAPPVRCLFVTGGPGIGKSTLLAESVRRFCQRADPLVLRLDFDRAGLDVQDQVGLTMEAARQLAEQIGDAGAALLDARLEAGHVQEPSAKLQASLRQSLPDALARSLGAAVAGAGRPVLVVLDTLEVLRGRGQTHPEKLFGWLDSLLTLGVKPMHVLAAGRGDALDSMRQMGSVAIAGERADDGPGRVRRMELPGLEDDAARAFLARLEAPRHAWRQLLELAQGNPLKLRLGAEIARRTGADRLPTGRRGREVSAAFLYRFLLSRIEDPDLKRLAHPGLIVRRIDADVIREVLAPKLGLGAISPARAEDLLQQLATQHWLVEFDAGAPGFLKHRSDMRALLLPLLYRSSPAQSARIDAAAVAWFAARRQPWADLEAVYHQLQLTRTGRVAPSVPAQIAAQFDEEMLDELPRAAADLVRATRGQRTSRFRATEAAAAGALDDAGSAREILAVVQRQDWAEGAYLVHSVMEAGGLDVRSQAADAIRTFLWRSGQWAQARRWLAERDRFDPSDDDLPGLPEPLALARLEMRAEFDPEGLRRRWKTWTNELQRLQGATVSATDNTARHGALALLLANLPQPFRFPRAGSRESDLAAAANDRWGGGDGPEAALAEELGRERLRRAAPEAADGGDVPSGRVLATLTPYAVFASNLSVMDGHAELRAAAAQAAQALAAAGALLGGPASAASPAALGSPIAWLSDVGLFAEWAEATAFVRRDGDLRLIGRAAERWRRTMAGDWSIGRRRGAWLARPPLDDTLRDRLRRLGEASDPAGQARAQLDVWAAALGTDTPRLLRRLSSGAPTDADPQAREDLDAIARRLLARGTPAALAPALAVFAWHGRPTRAGTVRQARTIPMEADVKNEERLEALRKQFTPDMEAAARAAIDAGRLPRSLLNALPPPTMEALAAGQTLESVANGDPTALAGLEAIVLLVGRPPLLIRNDRVVLEPMPKLPPHTPALIRGVEKWVPSVGRIEFRNHGMSWGGTGWVAGHKGKGALVVTNRHVAKIVARRKLDGTAVFMRAPSGARYGAAIDFGEEVESQSGDDRRTAELTRIEYLADDASVDVALLWIEAAGFELPSPFELVPAGHDAAKDDLVALIGYPAYDSRNDADAQAHYFRDLYEVKRFAPGMILQPAAQGLLTYDCTSLGGNSGSPLIRLEDGKVVGLHFSGVYGKANTAVSAASLRALLKGERPASVLIQRGREEAGDGSHAADHFKDRQGFDTAFLRNVGGMAIATPWPGLTETLAADLATPSDEPPEPNELRYTHFGVKYSARHKAPLVTAVNIDGEAARRIKRGVDRWFADGRIPRNIQLGADNFKDAEIDRGHMVRREDPNWGDAKAAQQANDDTFHYVNAAAQHSRLNQGKALWQGLENYILDNARTHGFRACVFTGPILRDEDDDEDEIFIDDAIVPIEFWKLVATLDADDQALHATAYVLSQGQLIRKLLEKRSRREGLEGVVLGAYRTFQVAISDLADATGYDFSAYAAADPLARQEAGREALRQGEPLVVPLDEATDIVL